MVPVASGDGSVPVVVKRTPSPVLNQRSPAKNMVSNAAVKVQAALCDWAAPSSRASQALAAAMHCAASTSAAAASKPHGAVMKSRTISAGLLL